MFKVIYDLHRIRLPIVSFWVTDESRAHEREKPSTQAVQNIIQSVLDYNLQYGFQLKKPKPGQEQIDHAKKHNDEMLINRSLFNKIITVLS